MPSVAELTAAYGNFMLAPRHGPNVCDVCFNLTNGYARCYACSRTPQCLDVVAPISYSVAHEQLHHVLAAYKRLQGRVAEQLGIELAAVLWRYLAAHEGCLAGAVGLERFPLATTVAAGTAERDATQPLRRVIGLIEPLRDRYVRLLQRTDSKVLPRQFDRCRFACREPLNGDPVLLIDDTWTSGASAQSAAAALKTAGAGAVVAVVIGRHLNRPWRANHARLGQLPMPFDWSCCARCDPARVSDSRRRAAPTL